VIELQPATASRLEGHRVRIDVHDDDTLCLHGVPTNDRFFNKPRTNVLLKRAQAGMPFMIAVDADLEYLGADRTLAHAFAGAHKQQGWRVLLLASAALADCDRALDQALTALGADGRDPAWAPPSVGERGERGERARLLPLLGTDLTATVQNGLGEHTVGREDEIEEVTAGLLRATPCLPLITGPSGAGKTNLLHGLAQRLAVARPGARLYQVRLGSALAGTMFGCERERILQALLDEAAGLPEVFLAVEDFELILAGMSHGGLLTAHGLESGAKLAGVTALAGVSRLNTPPLGRHLHVVELREADAWLTMRILVARRPGLEARHRVEIDKACLPVCLKLAGQLPGRFPAKAIALLDAAAAQASLGGASVTGVDNLYSVAAHVIRSACRRRRDAC
jgi:ATP-dependent Clp protease ATP-binding subunit ClpA